MIRALALILGLLIGLAGAVTMGGSMAHLRLVAGNVLPVWTEGLAPDAGILRGEGRLLGAALRWHLAGVDAKGPRWTATLAGDDWQAQGVLRVGPAGLRVEAVQGLIPGAVLAGGGLGALAVRDGALDLPGGDGWLAGRANGLTLGRDAAPVSGDVRIEALRGVWNLTQP